MTREPIQAVIERRAGEILRLPGVVGIGAGADSSGSFISVLVASPETLVGTGIPPALDGYPVRVEVTGRLRPFQRGRQS